MTDKLILVANWFMLLDSTNLTHQYHSGTLRLNDSLLYICKHNQWKIVCSRSWGNLDAAVACRQLGYDGTMEAEKGNFARFPAQPVGCGPPQSAGPQVAEARIPQVVESSEIALLGFHMVQSSMQECMSYIMIGILMHLFTDNYRWLHKQYLDIKPSINWSRFYCISLHWSRETFTRLCPPRIWVNLLF